MPMNSMQKTMVPAVLAIVLMFAVAGGGSLEDILPVFYVLAFFAVLSLLHFLPRLTVYVIGPGVLACAAALFILGRKYFFFFQSDGSPAGFVIPILMWGFLGFMVLTGVSLIRGGLERLGKEARREAPSTHAGERIFIAAVLVIAIGTAAIYALGKGTGSRPDELARTVSCSAGREEREFHEFAEWKFMLPCLSEAQARQAKQWRKDPKSAQVVDEPQLRYLRQETGPFLALAPATPADPAAVLVEIAVLRDPEHGTGRQAEAFRKVRSESPQQDAERMALMPRLRSMLGAHTVTFHCTGTRRARARGPSPQVAVCRAALANPHGGLLISVRAPAAEMADFGMIDAVLGEAQALVARHVVAPPGEKLR
jgi:hypothetical protein